jgi:hypothetical protein
MGAMRTGGWMSSSSLTEPKLLLVVGLVLLHSCRQYHASCLIVCRAPHLSVLGTWEPTTPSTSVSNTGSAAQQASMEGSNTQLVTLPCLPFHS